MHAVKKTVTGRPTRGKSVDILFAACAHGVVKLPRVTTRYSVSRSPTHYM